MANDQNILKNRTTQYHKNCDVIKRNGTDCIHLLQKCAITFSMDNFHVSKTDTQTQFQKDPGKNQYSGVLVEAIVKGCVWVSLHSRNTRMPIVALSACCEGSKGDDDLHTLIRTH